MIALELRLGNFIRPKQSEITNFYTVVIGIIESKIFIPCEDEPTPFKETDFEGMLLTKEWLLAFGFTGNDNQWWSKSGLIIGYLTTDDNYEFEFNRLLKPAQIKYVHELQNLYFALTGEELQLKN